MIVCSKCGIDIAPSVGGVVPQGALCESCKKPKKSRIGRVSPYIRCTRCGRKGHTSRTCHTPDRIAAKVKYNPSKKWIEKAT